MTICERCGGIGGAHRSRCSWHLERVQAEGTDTVGICQALTGCVNALGHHNRRCPAIAGRQVTAAEELARRFHEAYERLAPSYGYETRRDSAVPWEQVPPQNRALITAVCAELMPAPGTDTSTEDALHRVLDLADEMETGPLLVRGDSTAARIRAVAGPQRDHDEEGGQ